jgi:hexosaminidase
MTYMKQIVTVALLLIGLIAVAQDNINIVPKPAEVKTGKGNFNLSAATVLVIKNGVDDKTADYFNAVFKSRFGYALKKVKTAKANFVQFTTLQTLLPGKEGAYSLNITSKSIVVYGQTASGTFSGMQTLIQLLPGVNAILKKSPLPIIQLSITDYPRFQYRGMHLDVARHFMPVDFVKKYIDYLAAYKYNTFHWHLTDDQGWRIEIKKYPLLTQVGGWRNGTIIGRYPGTGNDNKKHGGFYTQEQIKEIIKYAADRYITIIPEIEMPGHASAAIAAYPQLSCFPEEDTKIPSDCVWSGAAKGKMVQQTWGVFEDVFAPTDYTFSFLQNVLDEVTALFPSKYIHIGGDECPKEAWKRSSFCQQLIKDNKLKDEHGLQSYFISRIEKYLNSKGRSIIGWDEILEGGLAPNATVMSWRGEEGGIEAARQNHDVVMTPGSHCYFDHSQSRNEDSVTIGGYLPLEKVYSYEPVPEVLSETQAKHILGAQANLWTEYIGYQSKAEYMIFPRMLALSEVLWSPREKRDWKDFERRLPVLFDRLREQAINHSRAYYDLTPVVQPSAAASKGIEWKLSSKNKNEEIKITYTGPLRIALQQKSKGEVLMPVTHQGTYVAVSGSGNVSLTQEFKFNKATGKKITIVNPPSKSYPGDGAFTLVNGVQNEKGLSKSNEFLGFSGTDLDVTIDLGAITGVSKITLHTLGQSGSWIYQPAKVEVQYLMSLDTDNTPIMAPLKMASVDVQQLNGHLKITVPGNYNCRYVRVIAKNYGVIPAGNPGAGEKAWLFADEIEVE